MYVNLVGGQDELVFDGASFVSSSDEGVVVRLPAWRSVEMVSRWRRSPLGRWRCDPTVSRRAGRARSHYFAMVVGLHDYVEKNRFPGVVIGFPAASIVH